MNLDRITESSSDNELGVEVGALKDQIEAMQKTLNEMQHSTPNDKFNLIQGRKDNETAAELLIQMQDFRNQSQKQQMQCQEQLHHSLNQAIHALSRMQDQIQTNEILAQMNGLIEQAQQQLSQINLNTSHIDDTDNSLK
jgi:hypothetical protein